MQPLAFSCAATEFVQITDCHIGAKGRRHWGIDTFQTLGAVLKAVLRAHLHAALLMTGDLAQEPVLETYERIRERVARLDRPVYRLPGNHDDAALLNKTLRGGALRADRSLSVPGWQIILLDSTGPNPQLGVLAGAELERLDHCLSAAPERHALIALHHHPIPIQSRWLDAMGLANASEFLHVLDRHAQVRAVIFGHIHQAFEAKRRGVRYLGCPSSSVQFVSGSPGFALDAIGPGYRYLRLHADGGLDTSVHHVTLAGFRPRPDY
jgi:3',5'-cyclic-AMP phosphodiesterase